MRKINFKHLLTIYLISFFAFLSKLFVYTGDDWAWGSSIGIERLKTFFENYNNRYLGNLTVLLLTRSTFIRMIVITLTIIGIIYIIKNIINKKRIDIFLITSILIINIPKLIFRETISWTAGFSNYTISALLTLIYIYTIKDIQNKEINNKISIKTILLFLLGISSNLFIEHLTIYNLVLSLFILIYHFIKYKNINKNLISHSIGSLIGFVIMFHSIGTSGERSIGHSIKDLIINICYNYFGVMYEEMVYHNLLLNIILFMLIFILIKKNKTNIFQKTSFFITTTYIFYSILNIFNLELFGKYTPHFEGIFTFIFGITFVYLLLTLIKNKLLKQKIIFYIGSLITLSAPLLLVSPIGSRCFIITYLIFIILVLDLYNYLIKESNKTNYFLILLIFISSIRILPIYITNDVENSIRLNRINEDIKNNEKVIFIERFTYEDYIHGNGTPAENTLWEKRYKLFYNIDEKIKIKIAFEDYKKIEDK